MAKSNLTKQALRLLGAPLALGLLTACNSGSESSSGSSVQGFNMSGLWSPLAVECFDSEFSIQTTYASLAFFSHPSTLLIQGNQASLQISSSSCLAEQTSQIRFQVTETQSEGGVVFRRGLMEQTEISSTTDTEALCEFTQSLIPESLLPEISPASWTLSFTHGESSEPSEGLFLYITSPEGTYLSLSTTLTVLGRPTDFCTLTYEKI